ncbi:MAG: hypothetical protein GEU71_08260 [Actinobacteria bacterium]|nr:hypothetical protein [Actinomycetota bacterium]
MGRIAIGTSQNDPRVLGRPLMSDHNLSARLWATAALISVPLASVWNYAWWLPLHLALLGAATQAIVGGQLMFSATLGLSRGPSRNLVLVQLLLLNVGALLVVGGRQWHSDAALAAGVVIVTVVIGWVTFLVHRLWSRSVNRRFAMTGVFYRLAGVSIILGATIGGALALGAFNDAASYLEHRSLHMTLNVLGWVGLTVVGTAITLLPTILHVRAPKIQQLRPAPWLMFGGLMVFSTGASLGLGWMASVGLATYAAGFAIFGFYVRKILAVKSRRQVPTAALHLVSAVAWLAVTVVAGIILTATSDHAALRDFIVVGGAAGFVFQALLGAWAFLLPSTRAPIPEQRRRELVAMELGGRLQVAAYNLGLVAAMVGLRTDIDISLAGIILAWTAAVSAMTKSWIFPYLGRLRGVQVRSDLWWAPPSDEGGASPPT